MKLGCASWGFREMDLAEYFEAASALGVGYLEVECFKDEKAPGHIRTGCSVEQLLRVQEEAKRKGLRIVALAGGNDFTTEDEVAAAKDAKRIRQMIDLAGGGGVGMIRLFAGFMEEDQLTDTVYDRVSARFREAGEYARGKKVRLSLENHGGITRSAAQVKRLIDGIGLPTVGVNYDPANFQHVGEDPVEALEVLKEHIVYVHLKDSRRRGGACEYTAVGEGDVAWAPILAWLEESYDGYAMIEYESPVDIVEGTRRSLAFLRG